MALKGKKLDSAVDASFKKHGNGIQFDIFDLGKIRRDVINAYSAGGDIDEATIAAVAKYRGRAEVETPARASVRDGLLTLKRQARRKDDDMAERFTLEWFQSATEEVYDVLNKTAWPDGPWKREPDLFTFKHHGLWCAVYRSCFGTLNGYVRIEKSHRLAGCHFMDLVSRVPVHGGVTLSKETDDGAWVIGFDCGHRFDYTPSGFNIGEPEYRDFGYVHEETIKLARFLNNEEV